MTTDEELVEKLFEMREENAYLRGQITYLQEQLASAEDEVTKVSDYYESKIEELEQQLGDALYKD